MYEFVTCLSWDYCVDGELDITLYDIEVRLRGWAKLIFLFFRSVMLVLQIQQLNLIQYVHR